MRTPGYTADVSLCPVIGRYGTAFTSAQSHGMVAPQLMAVVTYIPDWALASTSDPWGWSAGAGGGATPTPGAILKCKQDCAAEWSAAIAACNRGPRDDRWACKVEANSDYDSCLSICR
jgi:hypothetical protein